MFTFDSQITSSQFASDALKHFNLSGCQFLSVEENANTLLNQWLDRYSGIDWLIKDATDAIYGLSTRMRYVSADKPKIYEDFTIRADRYSGIASEDTKRTRALTKGSLFPVFTCQCWYSGSNFQCGAMMSTSDLYTFMKQQPHLVSTMYSDRTFYCVKWNDIKSAGFPISIVTGSKYQA